MRAANSAAGWGWPARLLHWSMAALILAQIGLGVWMVHFTPDLIRRFQLTQTHKSLGFLVFVLALARLGWRLAGPAGPRMPAGAPAWQARAAAWSHALLYALMLVVPLSGWVMAAASPLQDLLGIQNMVFGLFAMPDPWVPGAQSIEDAARAVHVAGALALALLVALHAAAALRHHFVDRDDVLVRMVFERRIPAAAVDGDRNRATNSTGNKVNDGLR